MNFRTLLFAGVAGLIATPLLAVSQETIDSIVADLSGQGVTKVEITDFGDRIKVEAYSATGKIERIYSTAGELVSEETRSNSGGFDGRDDDDDDDFDDDDDDRDDDHDDDHDDDDDDDDDRDDDKDDDRDDDKNDDDD